MDDAFNWKVTIFCMYRMACTCRDKRQLMEIPAPSVSVYTCERNGLHLTAYRTPLAYIWTLNDICHKVQAYVLC